MDDRLVGAVSARSAVLSLLLGANPPSASARDIVAAMKLVGLSESTTRVALTRMVASGDLTRSNGVYSLSARLAQRQRDMEPPEQATPWTGRWEMAIITANRRTAADRVALRREMRRLRVAELREGVWTRPANLRRRWPDELRAVSCCFEAAPLDDPGDLVAQLWDLTQWSERGHRYLDALAAAHDEPAKFRTMVAAVNHLQTDPLLPEEFHPPGWSAPALAAVYADYRQWLIQLREDLDPRETFPANDGA